MTTKKYFYSVADTVQTAEIKIKRSVFTCSLAYAGTIESAKAFISRISKENKTATHNCWAYIVGDRGEIHHCSDAGEPAGTAGRPMLNTLSSHDMTMAAAVVTRQYGGVKLGIRGLIRAYSESVEAAIAVKPLKRLVKSVLIRVSLPYSFNETFLSQAGPFHPVVLKTEYAENVLHDLTVEEEAAVEFQAFLAEYAGRGRLTYEIQAGD